MMNIEPIAKVWADKLQSLVEAVFGAKQGAWFLHVPHSFATKRVRRKKRPTRGSRLPSTTFAIGPIGTIKGIALTFTLLLMPNLSGAANIDNRSDTVILTPIAVPVHYITTGTVTSDHKVAIGSRLSGYIRDLKVREGERVSKNQLLFRIDPVDVRQQLAQSEANLSNAHADLRRFQSLLDHKAINRQQFDQVQLRFDVAKSKVKQARNQLNYAVVRAPLDGVVVQKRQHNGDLATPGTPVLMVENTLNMTVNTQVSEQFVAQIHIGDHPLVRMTGFAQPLTATVRQVVAAADSRSHQFLVKLTLATDRRVRAGAFAEIIFVTGTRQVMALPTAAIIHRHGLDGVYWVDTNHIVHWRLVRLGAQLDDGRVEIAAGLNAAAQVVRHPLPTLHSGDSINH